MSLVALSLVPAGKDWAQQDGYKAVSVPALHGLFAEWFCECTWGHSFFFFCLYILFSETQSGKIKKKRGGGYLEDILLEGFWVMSWPVVMPDASW